MNLYFCENISSGVTCHFWAKEVRDIPYHWTYIQRVKLNHNIGETINGV